jgi:hypothetical protein
VKDVVLEILIKSATQVSHAVPLQDGVVLVLLGVIMASQHIIMFLFLQMEHVVLQMVGDVLQVLHVVLAQDGVVVVVIMLMVVLEIKDHIIMLFLHLHLQDVAQDMVIHAVKVFHGVLAQDGVVILMLTIPMVNMHTIGMVN